MVVSDADLGGSGSFGLSGFKEYGYFAFSKLEKINVEMSIFSCNKRLNFKENMWKLKLKVCLINFLAYSLCTFLLCLRFHKKTPYRQDFGPTAIDYMYKLEGENSSFSLSVISLPDPFRFELNEYMDDLRNENR